MKLKLNNTIPELAFIIIQFIYSLIPPKITQFYIQYFRHIYQEVLGRF